MRSHGMLPLASFSSLPYLMVKCYLLCMLQVFEQMPEDALAFLEAELSFFDAVTDISGSLYPVPKDERKAGAVRLAREVRY